MYNHRGCKCDICTAARRAYDAEWRKRNRVADSLKQKTERARERRLAASRRRRRENLAWARLIKKISGCSRCGRRDVLRLHFHHLDPELKLDNVISLIQKHPRVVRAEIAKCVVLCERCHQAEHYG